MWGDARLHLAKGPGTVAAKAGSLAESGIKCRNKNQGEPRTVVFCHAAHILAGPALPRYPPVQVSLYPPSPHPFGEHPLVGDVLARSPEGRTHEYKMNMGHFLFSWLPKWQLQLFCGQSGSQPAGASPVITTLLGFGLFLLFSPTVFGLLPAQQPF